MSFKDDSWKGYKFYNYITDWEYPWILIFSDLKTKYAKYIIPKILEVFFILIYLPRIRGRLWSRHIKPFRWT